MVHLFPSKKRHSEAKLVKKKQKYKDNVFFQTDASSQQDEITLLKTILRIISNFDISSLSMIVSSERYKKYNSNTKYLIIYL